MTDLSNRPPARSGPMPFSVLLDEAMRRTRRHFRAIYPAVAIPLALSAAAVGVFQALWIQSLVTTPGQIFPFLSLPTLLVAFLQLIVLILGVVALQKATVDATAGRPVDMKAAWRFIVRPAVLGTLFLLLLALGLSLIACILPFFFVAPLLSFTTPIMAEEDLYGTGALSRSAHLAVHNPEGRLLSSPIVKAFVLLLVTLVISWVVSFLVGLPFQIPMFLSIFRDAAAGKDPAQAMAGMSKLYWIQIPAQILQTLTTVAIYLYWSFGTALLFFDTRSRKEGSDLAAEIQTVFGPGPGPGAPVPGELAP